MIGNCNSNSHCDDWRGDVSSDFELWPGRCYHRSAGWQACTCAGYPPIGPRPPPPPPPTRRPTGAPAPTVPAPTQSPATQVDLCAGEHNLINLTSLAIEEGGSAFCRRYDGVEASCIVAFFRKTDVTARVQDTHARCSYNTSTGECRGYGGLFYCREITLAPTATPTIGSPTNPTLNPSASPTSPNCPLAYAFAYACSTRCCLQDIQQTRTTNGGGRAQASCSFANIPCPHDNAGGCGNYVPAGYTQTGGYCTNRSGYARPPHGTVGDNDQDGCAAQCSADARCTSFSMWAHHDVDCVLHDEVGSTGDSIGLGRYCYVKGTGAPTNVETCNTLTTPWPSAGAPTTAPSTTEPTEHPTAHPTASPPANPTAVPTLVPTLMTAYTCEDRRIVCARNSEAQAAQLAYLAALFPATAGFVCDEADGVLHGRDRAACDALKAHANRHVDGEDAVHVYCQSGTRVRVRLQSDEVVSDDRGECEAELPLFNAEYAPGARSVSPSVPLSVSPSAVPSSSPSPGPTSGPTTAGPTTAAPTTSEPTTPEPTSPPATEAPPRMDETLSPASLPTSLAPTPTPATPEPTTAETNTLAAATTDAAPATTPPIAPSTTTGVNGNLTNDGPAASTEGDSSSGFPIWAIIAAAAALLVCVGGVWCWCRRSSPPPPPPSKHGREVGTVHNPTYAAAEGYSREVGMVQNATYAAPPGLGRPATGAVSYETGTDRGRPIYATAADTANAAQSGSVVQYGTLDAGRVGTGALRTQSTSTYDRIGAPQNAATGTNIYSVAVPKSMRTVEMAANENYDSFEPAGRTEGAYSMPLTQDDGTTTATATQGRAGSGEGGGLYATPVAADSAC